MNCVVNVDCSVIDNFSCEGFVAAMVEAILIFVVAVAVESVIGFLIDAVVLIINESIVTVSGVE